MNSFDCTIDVRDWSLISTNCTLGWGENREKKSDLDAHIRDCFQVPGEYVVKISDNLKLF